MYVCVLLLFYFLWPPNIFSFVEHLFSLLSKILVWCDGQIIPCSKFHDDIQTPNTIGATPNTIIPCPIYFLHFYFGSDNEVHSQILHLLRRLHCGTVYTKNKNVSKHFFSVWSQTFFVSKQMLGYASWGQESQHRTDPRRQQ